jgi:hypothetical protein
MRGVISLDVDLDTEAIAAAEASINSFIERRARESEDARRTEEAWVESVEKYNEKCRDLALSVGNDDGVLLALRAARQNNLEDVEAHIRTVRPDLDEICAELDFIEELPDNNPDDVEARFESIAAGVPSREDLLRTLG